MQWTPRPWESTTALVAGLVLVVGAVGLEPVGRLMVGAAGLLLLVVGARDLLLRPRLRVDEEGAVVRTAGGRVALPWARLHARVRTTRRLGTRSVTLELEDRTDDAVLLVLGRRDLGAAPPDVAAALWARGAAGG